MIEATVTFEGREIPKRLKTRTEHALSKILRAAAFEIAAEAVTQTERVDTGAMKNGWAVLLQGFDNQETVAAQAQAMAQRQGQERTTLTDTPEPSDPLTAYVVNVMSYAFYHEYGTARIPASPMLAPAVEAVRPRLQRMVDETLHEER